MVIGIMGAMPAEVDLLCQKLSGVTQEEYAGVAYHRGALVGKQVVVCCAGMGKANAAATVQVLCGRYGAEKIIFSGIAGNMSAAIGIGDVCVGKLVVYHDADTDCIVQSAPFLEEFPGDPALVQCALAACAACGVRAIAGKIATGDRFVGDSATKAAIAAACALPGLEAEGIFTHFAVSDESKEESRSYTALQHQRFDAMVAALAERGITFPICHCANSGATVSYPQFAHDMFRPGIITYGIGDQAGELGLRPVMTLKTTVGCIKDFAPDTTISYGRTFRTSRPSRVGVLPIGYADGLHRSLSNQWRVWTPYGTAPIVGRICMDMCMIDLTDLPQVGEGDEVEVYGVHNSVNDAAHLAGTISYELTCAVSKRVPRIYLRDGRETYRELLLRG